MVVADVFGIHNNSVETAVKLLILFLVVIYVALIYYTFADARRRIEDPMLIACATAAALFPFVGTIGYMIVPPPARVRGRRPRARARDAGRRGAPARRRVPAVPALRPRGQGRLPALPALPAQAQGPVRHVCEAARSGVEDLPLLRGRDPRRHAPAASPAPAYDRRRPRAGGGERVGLVESGPVASRHPEPENQPPLKEPVRVPDPHPRQARRVRAR